MIVNLISERKAKKRGMFMSKPQLMIKSVIRNIILESQHLEIKVLKVLRILSDICGLQYDRTYYTLKSIYDALEQKKTFTLKQLDIAAYKEFKVIKHSHSSGICFCTI